MTSRQKFVFLNRKPGLYLKKAGHKGFGLFCEQDIAADEELEITPALVLKDDDSLQASETILNDYVFRIGDVSAALRKRIGIEDHDAASAVVMGIASYCNHDDDAPNAEVIWEEHGGALYYTLRATKNITAGVEICTSYGAGWFDRD